MQPGDNFRVIASGNNDFYKRFKVKQDDTTGKLIDGNNNEIPIGNTTPMLTVWRRLHIEVDSMEEVPTTGPERNFIDGDIVKITGDSTKAAVVYVENCSPQAIDDGSDCLPTGNGRFEKGKIRIGIDQVETANIDGNGENYLQKSTGINIPFTITKGSVTKSGKVKSMNDIGDKIFLFDTTITETNFAGGIINTCGDTFFVDYSGVDTCVVNTTPTLSFKVWDDDQITGDVPMPDTSDLERVFKPAYVLPVFDVGDNNDNVEFKLNATGYSASDLRSLYDFDAQGTESDANFWTVYLFGGYQGTTTTDDDPNSEGCVLGVADDINGMGVTIFKEIFVSAEITPTIYVSEHLSVDHEVGHLFNGLHTDGGLMAQSWERVSIDFSDITLDKIRKISHP